MASKTKSHKAMSDSEWLSRLKKFASSGDWPAGEGNRPAPRQKKWHELYLRIEKCPVQSRGQSSLFGELRKCECGFHTPKQSTTGHVQQAMGQQSASEGQPVASAGSAQGSKGQQAAETRPVQGALEERPRTPSLNLTMFTKPRFGGAHISAAKPNLSTARKPVQTHVTSPSVAVASSSSLSTIASPQVPLTPPTAPSAVTSTQEPCTASSESATLLGALTGEASIKVQLPRLWSEALPTEDHRWILNALFRMGAKGKPELRDNLQLWYYPPQPGLLYHQAPAPDRFFSHPLLVWMPYRLWKVKVICPNPACGQHQLTGAGLHKRARRVLDVDRVYNMVTETLTCTKCRATHVSWSQTVLQQLDLAHRSEFRVILTRKYACDIRVIRLLRERGLGNSPTRLLKQLKENHTEEWLHRVARYTTECVDFSNRPSLLPLVFAEPPEPAVVPSCKWLLAVYSQDILTRLDDVKARITSTYGTIIKMDSTKKITKKLAGTAKGTGLWLTSVGNELGQVLISVLTAQEGAGLDMMADGLVRRYQQAGVDPPVVLYVDCGCCAQTGDTKLKTRFRGWPDLCIRLDIWHFMRRIALGCTTDAHQLYPIFMSRLSSCIFEWDAADVTLLREAKRQLLMSQGLAAQEDAVVNTHLTKEELALHCRRRTRGVETTVHLIEQLLRELMGSSGNDSLGVPLLDIERMEHIWSVQKKHIKCIQDPPGVSLYTETGSIMKGGVHLKTYRCARGSTSLESFHLHLNRFIPGSSANSMNFQIYLLEGLHRWNQDRATASLSAGPSTLRSYTGDLVHCVNSNFVKLFGRKVVPSFSPPAQYTGELIGIQYLFRQTGQALQDMNPDSEETAHLIEEHNVVDDREGDEGFCDVMQDPTVLDLEVILSPALCYQTSTLLPKEHCAISTVASNSSTMVPITPAMGPSPPALGSSTPALRSSTPALRSSTPAMGPSPPALGSSTPALGSSTPALGSSTPAMGPSPPVLGSSTPALGSSTSTVAPSTKAMEPSTFTLAQSTSTTRSSTSLLVSSSMAPCPTARSEAVSESEAEEMAVDDQNMPGFQHVDRLAEYLVELREQTSLFLTNQQASTIIGLWGNLLDGDKKRVAYSARHQQRLLSGRFRTPKKPSQTPGVESTTRCVLGASSAPAQWPDCCRVVETIFIRLCTIYPSPKRKGKGALSRWSLILRDYHKIRQLVLGNSLVMQETSLQLVEVNQSTLIQWHNNRVKRQELAVLLQGTNLPSRLSEATEPLLEPRTFPAEPVQAKEAHQYKLPESTAGQAKQRLQPIRPKAPVSKQLFASPAVPFHIIPAGTPFQTVPVVQTVPMLQAVSVLQPGTIIQGSIQQPATPTTTTTYGAIPKRPYRRTVQANTCKKCGQFRTNETGHSQYRGRVFCPQTETISREEWLVKMRAMFPK